MQKNIFKIFILIIISTGCRTLPKITPFVEASSEMRKGVNAGLLTIDNSLEMSELSSIVSTSAENQKTLDTTLKSLKLSRIEIKKNAKNLDKTLNSVTAYAAALNTLTESGNSGEKNALEALKSLTDVLNQVSPPAGTIVGITQKGVAKIAGEIAKVRAINKLRRVMDEASPIIDKYNEILPQVMDQILIINETVFSDKNEMILLPSSLNSNIMRYRNALENSPQYINNHKELYLIVLYENSTEKAKKDGFFENIKKMDASITDEKDIEKKQLQLIEQIKLVDAEKIRISALVEKIVATQKKYFDENKAVKQLFEKSKESINAWSIAHKEIREKLGEKSAPNFINLLEIVDDMKVIREKLKSLNP
jgi:hypothetical protein